MPHRFNHTIACELRDYPEWHYGRTRYGVWVLQVDAAEVLKRIDDARALLGDWLHPAGARQAHITLYVCGFSAKHAQRDDDFTEAQLKHQIVALAALSRTPFNLHIGGASSFSSAAYLTVSDPQQRLAPLRDALSRVSQEVRQSAYVPHLTLGLFSQSIAFDALQQRLSQVSSEPLTLAVTHLHYATYNAQEQHGPLHYEYSWALTPTPA